MTTHYESVHPVTLYPDAFHVAAPDAPVVHDLFPRRPGVFIRKMQSTDPAPVLERLCNVDFRAVPNGYATRTVIDHLGVYLIKHGPGEVRLYGPRSSAKSLLHALETAAASVW